MGRLISVLIVFLSALPAFARDSGNDLLQLPEPTTMALLGIGAAGLVAALKKKKK